MKRVNKQQILDIINQINDEMMDNGDNSMSVYECFDFNEEFNDDIARRLSKVISLNSNYQEAILKHMVDVIAYCGSVVPDLIIKGLFEKKMLLNKQKYNSLLKWVEDAFIVWKIKNTRFSQADFDDMLKKCHHSRVKQWMEGLVKNCPYVRTIK